MTNIKIVFRNIAVDDSYMDLKVSANDRVILDTLPKTENYQIAFTTDLPIKIQFDTHGKYEFDTKVDDAGNVVADKHILIEGICIDNIWIKKWMLESRLIQPMGSNYLGKNGVYWFEIDQTDILDFWLKLFTIDQ